MTPRSRTSGSSPSTDSCPDDAEHVDDLVPCEWCKGVGFQGPPDPGPCHGCDGAGYFDREASS